MLWPGGDVGHLFTQGLLQRQLITVNLDDLQDSFKDEGSRYVKTYLCICFPTFQLLDMKNRNRSITIKKKRNAVMSVFVYTPVLPTVPSWQTHGTRMGPARLSQHWHSSCRGRRTFSSIGHSWPALAPCKSKSTASLKLCLHNSTEKSSGQTSFLVLFTKVFFFFFFLINNNLTPDSGLPQLLVWFGNH